MSARWRSLAVGGSAVLGIGDGLKTLGSHVGERAARVFQRVARVRELPADREVEVEQHGDAGGRQQNVRRLDVAMSDAAAEGVVERLAQPGDDPGRRAGVGQAGQQVAGGPGRVPCAVFRGGDVVENGQQVGPDFSGAPRRWRSARTAASVAPPRNGMAII